MAETKGRLKTPATRFSDGLSMFPPHPKKPRAWLRHTPYPSGRGRLKTQLRQSRNTKPAIPNLP
ncbi:hypothetical protein [Neisseria bacilliformis]|uniref:hypothetical protein n=1 Tax=Neisseria bacilliformis TaxID=267212 RepID=UPI00128C50E4|nr:hypothetical protein [Neisseria bacilliformis]